MMPNNLFIRRLLVFTEEKQIAYDQRFHRGINIIRGQNSSGKSTIIRFIFFALGGCYGDFVPEALKCSHVVVEIEINGVVVTLKRELEKKGNGTVNPNAPMFIYYGSIDEYDADQHVAKWTCYGYKMSNDSRSFSNVLFEIMGLPEMKADSNITMHQILRLIYLDQESPTSSLFMFEQFDKEITRQTTADLLMGLYDETLSESKLRKLSIDKKLGELKQQIEYLGAFLPDNVQKSSKAIQAKIDTLHTEIDTIQQKIKSLREEASTEKVKKMEYQELQQRVVSLRLDLVNTEASIANIEAELNDSEFFISSLKKKIEAIEHSIATRDYFGSIHLEFCPECLSPIDNKVEDGHCHLCKSPIDNSKGKSQAMRIKMELDFQLRESIALLNRLKESLNEKRTNRIVLQSKLRSAQKEYDNAVHNVRSTQEEKIDELLRDKGFNEGDIMRYNDMLEKALQYEQLLAQQTQLTDERNTLDEYITKAEKQICAQRFKIEASLRQNGVYLLHHDQDRQSEFKNADDLVLSFKQNQVFLTNRKIKLSASSDFYLKMAARFAFFLSSIQNDSMMYPRLILSDNMEDKGMEDSRSQNFQKIIVDRLNQIEAEKQVKADAPDYQVIFATSMIAPELDDPKYTIGENYTIENKSLKMYR